MRISTLILVLLHLTNIAAAQKADVEKRALLLLKQYNPVGYYIVTETIKAPTKYQFGNHKMFISASRKFAHYISGKDDRSIVSSLGSVVHEMTHGYSHNVAFKILKDQNMIPELTDRYLVVPLNEQESILIKQTETFPSRELTEIIPEELRTTRFKTYVKTKNFILGTQKSGVYGLLGEFVAYYQDTKAIYDLYEYYTRKEVPANKDYLDYMSDFNGTFYAHVEFKHYILSYLIYAQNTYPQIYEDIVANKEFREAFRKVDALYTSLINNHFERIDEITNQLKERGVSVRVEGEYTWIENSGIGNFMEEYNLLNLELTKSKYQSMMEVLANR